ncbi:MAG: NUDIX domain-containing protein [Eubacterium sp.]|nr:NUDIX domain-containing protein [Eubacterium sp.]
MQNEHSNSSVKIIENRDAGAYEKATKTRVGCRGIVIMNSKMLICHELNSEDYYLIPGGGLEKKETLEQCCIREIQEETGYVVKPIRHFLTMKEYYEEYEYIGHYFICEVTGKTQQKLTAVEAERGVTPEWIFPDKMLEIFSKYKEYADINETKRRLYLRDYTALSEYISQMI